MAFVNTEDENVLITQDGNYLITEGLGSVRYQIMQAVIGALEEISIANGYNTDVASVSTELDIEHPEKIKQNEIPACMPTDGDEEKEALTFYYDTDDDILSKLTIIIFSVVFDRKGSLVLKRTNLMQDVEKAMMNNDDLDALLLDGPDPISVATDGPIGNYSGFYQEFLLKYTYNHTTGG